MCGVVAVSGKGANVAAALEKIKHRGIRSRVAASDRGAVGHVRLPIVGLGTEHDQPVERGPWLIGYVGEILDFRELHALSASDVGIAADAWAARGDCGFKKFDGFWTVVALNRSTGAIHVLVDYLAQKPAYYRRDVPSAASEPIALVGLAPTTPDEVYFASVLKWGYCPETWRTPHREIKKTLPGEHVVVYPSGHVKRTHADKLRPRSATPDELKDEIEAACRRRATSSDVPVAALVSGGLDSAITYTLAKRHMEVRPYHADNDELEEALAVAGGDELRAAKLERVDLAKALRYMQEPVDLGSLVPQVALSDAIAAAGAESVCLTGDGADEFFGGYGRALRYDSQASDVWHELVAWHLPRLDRVMMRNRIEVRSPFLARAVCEIALGLPRPTRTDKQILRDLFRKDLPRGVADRPKRPLRTHAVSSDREGHSRRLVEMFRREAWGKQ